MRVALVDPSLWTLPYDDALAGGLRAAGHEVTLYGRHAAAARAGEDAAAGRPDVVPAFYPATKGATGRGAWKSFWQGVKGVEHVAAMARLPRLLARPPAAEVVHFQWLPLPVADRPFLGALGRAAPLVLTLHDSTPFNGDAPSALTRIGVSRCFDAFHAVIVHTERARGRLLAGGVPPERVSLVPHGLLGRPPTPEGADGTPPEERPAAAGAPTTFLLFGKIRPYKGADVLVRAFGRLPAGLRDSARLRIVGEPHMDVASLAALAGACGAAARVSIEPRFVPDSEVPELFGPGTVAVLPYREADASGVLALAIAHGRPVVASRIGGFAELLEDGAHGRLVPPGDVEGLSGALADMLLDPAFARRCAANARALAARVPSWEEIGRRTAAVYEGATAAHAEQRRRLGRTGPLPGPRPAAARGRGERRA